MTLVRRCSLILLLALLAWVPVTRGDDAAAPLLHGCDSSGRVYARETGGGVTAGRLWAGNGGHPSAPERALRRRSGQAWRRSARMEDGRPPCGRAAVTFWKKTRPPTLQKLGAAPPGPAGRR